MKVSQNLARLGYIVGYRGKGGGLCLARPARRINLGEVVQRMEPNLKPAEDVAIGPPVESVRLFDRALEEAPTAFIQYLSGNAGGLG